MTLRLRRKHRTTVRIRQLASQISRTATCAGGLAIFSVISLCMLTQSSVAQQSGSRTYNPPVHIQPGQRTAVQRYSGIVEPSGPASQYSIVGSVRQTNYDQVDRSPQPRRQAPQLQNRIARALNNIAGRGGSQKTTQQIPQYNPQPTPTTGQRVANFAGPQTFRANTPIGTGVRSFNTNPQPTRRMERQPNTQFTQHRAARSHQTLQRVTQSPPRQQPTISQPRQFPVQQIEASAQQAHQYGTARSIASEPTYYDRPDIQATSAQQLDDEIYIEDEPEFHMAQTPAQLPSLQDTQTQAEPVSVLNTEPDNSGNRFPETYRDPVPSTNDTRIEPSISLPGNELRTQGIDRQDIGELPRQDEGRLSDPFERPCDEMRKELLGRSIKEIALDVSPLRSSNAPEYQPQSRIWTDQFGREIANGVITGVRRGYVIVESGGSIQRVPYGNLSDPDLDEVARFWQIPKECRASQDVFLGRSWTPQTITWKASNLCHKPLYFEDVQLERYGHSHGPFSQPVRSTVHFFSNLLLLPYNTGINPPNECRYALGYYRPGNCAPWLKDPFPISLAGTQRQISAMTGTGFLIIP